MLNINNSLIFNDKNNISKLKIILENSKNLKNSIVNVSKKYVWRIE